MPTPATKSERIQGIIQRHAEALSRDLAQELTQELVQPLMERWGITVADVVAVPDVTTAEATAPPAPSEPLSSTALAYDARSRRWLCPRCRKFSDTRRRSVTTHLRFCDGTLEPPTQVAPTARRKRKKKS